MICSPALLARCAAAAGGCAIASCFSPGSARADGGSCAMAEFAWVMRRYAREEELRSDARRIFHAAAGKAYERTSSCRHRGGEPATITEDAAEAAVATAERLGYNAMVLRMNPHLGMGIDTHDAAEVYASIGRDIESSGMPARIPACVVTVVMASGQSQPSCSRNQARALRAAIRLHGMKGVAFLSGGTADGEDAPPGAVVTGSDVATGQSAGLDAQAYAERADTQQYFTSLERAKYGSSSLGKKGILLRQARGRTPGLQHPGHGEDGDDVDVIVLLVGPTLVGWMDQQLS